MVTNVRHVVLILLLQSPLLWAFEYGDLVLQGQLELSRPLSPAFVTRYWDSSVNFSGGFGVVTSTGLVLFTYTNQWLNPRQVILIDESNGYAHEILVKYVRTVHELEKFSMFVQVSGGYTLLRTPILYKKSEQYPWLITERILLELPHTDDGPTVSVGFGLNFEISELSLIFLEAVGSTTFLPNEPYTTIRARTGVLFHIGQ